MNEAIFSDANFESEVLKSDKPVLVDFYADWCGPCKMQAPIIEEIAKAIGDQAKVGNFNVDENPETAQKYNILSIPTIIIFKNGAPVQTLSGLQNKDTLLAELNKVI